MAMSQASLKSRMIAELQTRGFNLEDSGWMDDFLEAIAQATYDEITTNARAVGTDTGPNGGDSHSLTIE